MNTPIEIMLELAKQGKPIEAWVISADSEIWFEATVTGVELDVNFPFMTDREERCLACSLADPKEVAV